MIRAHRRRHAKSQHTASENPLHSAMSGDIYLVKELLRHRNAATTQQSLLILTPF